MDKLPDVHDPAFRRARGLPDEAIWTKPISISDPAWANRLKAFWWHRENIKSAEPEIMALHELLLSIGGEETCLAKQDPDTERLLARGRYHSGEARLKRLEPGQCHQNACDLYRPGRNKIATGYALSDDGLWRQHSWIVTGEKITETTERRLAYFGYVLTEQEAAQFLLDNM